MAVIPQYQPGDPARITLLSYQKEAVDRSRAVDLFVCEKSRRTGVTLAFASEAVAVASAVAGAMDVFYLSYNLDMTREFMDDCTRFCEQEAGEGTGLSYKATRKRITFNGGKSINALPSSPRSLRGKQGVVIVDEAAFHDTLPEVLKAAIALTMWGGRIIVISTHNGVENAFASLVENIHMDRQPGDVMRLTLNNALDQGLYHCISRSMNRDWTQTAQDRWEANLRANYGESAREELDVVPARAPATWLDRPTIEAAMTEKYRVARLSLPPGLSEDTPEARTLWMEDWIADHVAPVIAQFDQNKPSYFGQDFARSSDLSFIMAGQYSDDAVLQCLLNIEMHGVHFELQKQLLRTICSTMPRFTAGFMDANGNGADVAEHIESLFGKDHITCVKATDGTYHKMMPRLKARIEDRTIAMPRDDGVITDLRMVKMRKGTPRIVDRTDIRIDGAKSRRHGDSAIALMHFVAAADVAEQVIEYLSTGMRDSMRDNGFVGALTFGRVPRGY
jgi:phage FluMu gp28-like protein